MWFLLYCISWTEGIFYQIPLLYFSLLCHIKLGLEVEGDRPGFSNIVLSWEFVGLEMDWSHAWWASAKWVRTLREALAWVLQPLVGSVGSSRSCFASPCLSSELSLSRSNSELVGISIAQSNQQKDQLLLAFELYQGTFNHHSFTNGTLGFARQYKRPTKPSPRVESGLSSKHCVIVHTTVWVEELSVLDRCLKSKLSVCVPELAEQIQEHVLVYDRLCSLDWRSREDRWHICHPCALSGRCWLTGTAPLLHLAPHRHVGSTHVEKKQHGGKAGKNMAGLAFAMNSCHPQLHVTWLGGSEQARASMSAKPRA